MPDLTKLPVPQHTGGQPYHAHYDNIPLAVLAKRDVILNGEVDYQSQVLKDAAGDQGNIANRMNQSIEENGNLKSNAVDQSIHNIAEHTDGSKVVETDELAYYVDTLGYAAVTNPVPFVRMLESERAKLALIASEATNLMVQVETPSNITLFDDGTMQLVPSENIHWEITAPNIVKAVLTISTDFAHRHYYDIGLENGLGTDDYINFTTPTGFVEGSLRVYINGIRLSSEIEVYYPSNPIATWTLLSFTADFEAGTFALSSEITEDDILRVDYEISLT